MDIYTGAIKDELVCETKVFRKNLSRPIVFAAYLSDYCHKSKDGMISERWKHQEAMIKSISLVNALKHAFPNMQIMDVDYESML